MVDLKIIEAKPRSSTPRAAQRKFVALDRDIVIGSLLTSIANSGCNIVACAKMLADIGENEIATKLLDTLDEMRAYVDEGLKTVGR